MYQSHVYLEVRILFSSNKNVFTSNEKNNSFSIDNNVLQRVHTLSSALNCKWREKTFFEKQTSTANFPQDLGISGISLLVAENGHFDIEFHSRKKAIHIEEIRIEEDAGRLTHSEGKTRMDYTNAGMPSIRIKTSHNIELGEEAFLFLEGIKRLLQYLKLTEDVSVDSAIRCNAYVSLAKYPDSPSYYIKLRNLNSFNFARKAINSELSRQEDILVSGGKVASESRLWNERQNITEPYKSRQNVSKFEPLIINNEKVYFSSNLKFENVHKNELPEARAKRLAETYGFSKTRSSIICDEKQKADFFETCVSLGAKPTDTAHWMTSELQKLQKKGDNILKNITPEFFAFIIKLFSEKKISSSIAKQLLQEVAETGKNPEILLKENNLELITKDEDLIPVIQSVIKSNPKEVEKLKNGDMAPLEFLTGLVMKKTNKKAEPVRVKHLLKKELNINLIYIFSLGGTISANTRNDGAVAAANTDEAVLKSILSDYSGSTRYQIVSLGHLLSEEIEPSDWAVLIAEISNKINTGTANGIIVTHGTDTLSYTAALLFWLFSDSDVPIVLTASSKTPDTSDEAKNNLMLAMETATKEKSGVYVSFGEKILSPLNLKFINTSPTGFVNWNMKSPIFTKSGSLAQHFSGITDLDPFVLKQVLKEAADSMIVCKVYPGLKMDLYTSLIKEGISNFILELYETGTGSMRRTDYSLKSLLIKGRKNDCRFFCTSQQESPINFSQYSTSRRVWREGAVPMGRLTTESAVALYFATSLVADSQEEFDTFMESYAELYQS